MLLISSQRTADPASVVTNEDTGSIAAPTATVAEAPIGDKASVVAPVVNQVAIAPEPPASHTGC